ncbi:MAG: glycosyltransferase [Cyanobacteriota bacterium]|nr:glycosyltransferase [Cyanobacteriota bacterium]
MISIIIPVYNGEKTIEKTLNSVFQQTFQDIEILIIDDGSQDKTLEIVNKTGESKLKIHSQKNSGQAAARNKGIELAKGEYIAFLDADDLWTPDKLERQLNSLQTHPEAAVAYSWTDYIDESGSFVQHGRKISAEGDVYSELLTNNFIENGSNVLVRKSALDEVGNFETSLPPAADWDMWLRLAKCYPFVVVRAPQVLYRVSSSSSSSNLVKQETQCLRVIDRAFEASPNLPLSLKKRSRANIYKYLAWKALEHSSSRKNAALAFNFTWNYILNEPAIAKELKFASILLVKSAIATLLSPQYAKSLLTKKKTG